MSPGGLLLELPERLPKRAHLEILMHTGRGTWRGEAEVIWVQPPFGRSSGRPLIRHGLRLTAGGLSPL